MLNNIELSEGLDSVLRQACRPIARCPEECNKFLIWHQKLWLLLRLIVLTVRKAVFRNGIQGGPSASLASHVGNRFLF